MLKGGGLVNNSSPVIPLISTKLSIFVAGYIHSIGFFLNLHLTELSQSVPKLLDIVATTLRDLPIVLVSTGTNDINLISKVGAGIVFSWISLDNTTPNVLSGRKTSKPR